MDRINLELLPIKAHYFFYMAAMGPILPQLSVFGREMGISAVIMGSITGLLPLAFLVAKPLFGIVVDVFRNFRKAIFVGLIVTMSTSYALLYVIPARSLSTYSVEVDCLQVDTCNVTAFPDPFCNTTTAVTCSCSTNRLLTNINGLIRYHHDEEEETLNRNFSLCVEKASTLCNSTCDVTCKENVEIPVSCLYFTPQFWLFIVFMSIGTICFNVTNSITDAICFDVIGDDYDYGKQRVWGTIGFGLTALISGYVVNLWSDVAISYRPAIIVMLIFTVFDLMACFKLKLPIIEAPVNIFKDLTMLLSNRHTITFILFSVCAGIVDSLFVYFLFWHLEDLAAATQTRNIKLIEGLIVAAETLGGEVIFFYLSGVILERFGHAQSFSMCFIMYALRLGLISIIPNPWWALPIEFVLQGPTYALTYTTIVAYANVIAPLGMSATMQGLAAGMDDGFGYALGSILGGLLYNSLGGRGTFQVFSAFALIASIAHTILHRTVLRESDEDIDDRKDIAYHIPPENVPDVPDVPAEVELRKKAEL